MRTQMNGFLLSRCHYRPGVFSYMDQSRRREAKHSVDQGPEARLVTIYYR
ncbi:hypothetical protein QUF94_23485 [Peribacillus sp. NJ4]|nr:hypothetical protein [Peribacillus sp. NJ4]